MRLTALVLVALLVATGCTPATPPLEVVGDVLPKSTPTPTPIPVPAFTPALPPAPLPPSAPFVVRVDDIGIRDVGNGDILGVANPVVDDNAVLAATRAAATKLESFLNAMFVNKATYFTEGAITLVIAAGTVPPEAMAGLGVLSRPDLLLGTVAHSAAATARVLVSGGAVASVTLSYSASLDLELVDGSGPVVQEGVASFADRGAGMQLMALHAETTYGGPLEGLVQ